MAKAGILEVTLKNATELKDVDILGRQDPYGVLACGKINHRSKTHTNGGKNPVWNETFTFPDINSGMTLKLQLYDENTILRDVSIGSCKISLANAALHGSEDVTVPVVTKKGKERGTVNLHLAFLSAQQMATRGSKTKPAGNWILPTYANTDCWKDYEPGIILGKGSFGTIYQATKKGTSEKYAVKVISKRKLTTPEEAEDVRREVQIMHHLAGHVNVVVLKNVYEDKSHVCLVMELCSGGELFDCIVKRGHYTEKDAATLIRSIVSVVLHCHNMGVVHRDLKPENFLLADKSASETIKATDFGLSSFFKEGDVLTDIVGSAYYVAPEVLRRSYGKEADLWSCGVILYILLCGYPPFHGDNEKKIFEAVISKPIDFQSQPWPRISEPAKDCVRRMLVRDPRRRSSAQTILNHEWMKEHGVASDNVIEIEVLTRIKKFSAMNRLKKEALKVIALNLPMDEIRGMRELFKGMDVDNSGTITIDEFTSALKTKGSLLPDADVAQLMRDSDINGDGNIDYEEFLAATVNLSKLEREDNLKQAFAHFDIDGDGHITHDELTQSLEKLGMNNSSIQDIIKEVDTDNSGTIDYNEFCIMMRNLES
eukprot:gene2097-18156_t